VPVRKFGARLVTSPRRCNSAAFLAGVSVLALLTHATPADAACLGRCGGGGVTSAVNATATSAISSAQQAAAMVQQSMNSLSRATLAIQAMQAAQSAARNLAASTPNSVPSGLAIGGLVPDSGLAAPGISNPVTTWVGANTPTQTTSNGQTTVTINQTQPQALLNWQTFNVSSSTTVNFNQQGNASWLALNRIAPSGVPSQILGQIKADGQVLLINQNGIIFGGTSQINVHTLIASTLDLGFNDQQFLQNGLFSGSAGAIGAGAASFTTQKSGTITVEPGAVIDTTARLTSTGDGGYVALLGAGGVINSGTIITQNGQIILAADKSVTLITPLSTAVGVNTAIQVSASGGPVINAVDGLLMSNDGAVTLAGGSISQLGGIVATTSTTRTASISLSAACSLGSCTGNVVLGANSLTTILPDESSDTLPTATANSTVGSAATPYFQAVLQPQINIQARNSVDVQGGALIKAPSAALTINAGTPGTVLLEPGSTIDLSGLAGVTLPMSINEVTFKVTAAEVADDPLARNLIGQTVTIDARLSGTRADGFHWVGSPILDAAGYAGLIPETIDQLLTTGGSLTTSAANVVQQPGAVVNVSGGYVQYLGGVINTTRLLGADGRIYSIGSANPYVAYIGVLTGFTVDHAHWNVTDVYADPLISGGYYEPGYIAGANAGSINVTAIAPIIAGDIVGDVVVGRRQRALAASSNVAAADTMPTGAALGITFADGSVYNVVLEPQADAGPDPYGLSGLNFANASTWSPVVANFVFPVFSDVLSNASLNAISIKGARELSMPVDAALMVRPGGSITLDGVTTIAGLLSAPAGNISLTGFTYAKGTDGPGVPPVPALVVGPNAVLDVHGLWVNDTGLLFDQAQGPAFVNGGTVSISTFAASNGPSQSDGLFVDVTQSIVLSSGSVIDLSGGGYVGTTGTLKTGADGLPLGKGGSLTLTTYAGGFTGHVGDPSQGISASFNVPPHGTKPDGTLSRANQANVLLGGTIYSGGFDGGGTLTLQVPTIIIDGGAGQVTSYLSSASASALTGQSGVPPAGSAVSGTNAGQVVLPPSFFTNAGFSQYALTAADGGVTVTAGTQVVLQQTNFLATGREAEIPTGALLRSFASVGRLPDGLRKPLNLTLTAGANNVLLDRGAAIVADPKASVTLSALATANVLGSIVAPAGTISVSGDEVRIASGAVLDVSGVFVSNPGVVGYSTGTVLGGGTITLTASPGNLVAEPGALFDLQGAAVSAASNLIQIPQGGLRASLVGQAVWSNGGNLQLFGTNIYFAGTVDAAGGAPLATGGTLTIGGIASSSPSPNAIVVEPAGIVAANLPAVGMSTTPGAFIGADTLSNSGFDSVTLNAGTIAFAGSMNVTVPGALTLNATSGTIALLPASTGLLPSGIAIGSLNNLKQNFGLGNCGTNCILGIGAPTVNLAAGYVRLVGANDTVSFTPFVSPTLADGNLNVTAEWIDLQGVLALDNAGSAVLASEAAIRLLPANYGFVTSGGGGAGNSFGALVVPGNLTLQAAEIYPVTNVTFLMMSTGTLASASTITIAQNGVPTAPLSAGGGIVLNAKNIVQGGTLWAPLGNIILGLRSASDIPISTLAFLVSETTFTPAENVTLAAGSLTSVSAAGLVIPDGSTVDGTTWYQGAVGVGDAMLAPPSKSISLFGANVTTQPGAVLDLSGGGDIYATEYVAGTGGTRNVLTTYQQNLATGAFTPQYADGRQVYALVPNYLAAVAAYDPNFAQYPNYSGLSVPAALNTSGTTYFPNAIAPGQSVTIAPGSSIPAGTYTLLPGMYATLPGAYRIVQVASSLNPGVSTSLTGADGSQYVAGTLGNALTGARSAQPALFQLQSQAVWSKYSRIDITSGTTFFRRQALAASQALPPLPIDGGVLVLGATNTLNLAGTNLFAPGESPLAPGLVGGGGQVQISAANILVLAADQSVPAADCVAGSAPGCTGAAYLVLNADQISGLGAASVLIGGTAAVVKGAEAITASAFNLEVKSDAAHPLTGPELILVSQAGGNGVVVDAGGVVRAVGAVPAGTDRDITIGANPVAQTDNLGNVTGYTNGVSGDGSLLRVSNGTAVNVTRFYVPGQYTGPGPLPASATPQGTFSIGAGALIDGGNALTLDSSGSGALAPDAILKAANYDIAGSVINIGGGSSGVTLSPAVLANFNDAASVRLRSASAINLYDANGLQIGDRGHPIGTLTFDSAGLYGQGGNTTVNATNIDLANSFGATGTGISGAGGTLTLNASAAVTEDLGAKSLRGFGQVTFNGGEAVAFTGAGSLDAGTANILLSAPVIVVNAGATQSVSTSGSVSLATGAGAAPASVASNVGGALTITAASIMDTATIQALSGNVSLIATAGDVVLGAGANIDASGSQVAILDIVRDAPGGKVSLVSNAGNVIIDQGATVSVAAAGIGFAGSLSIQAPNSVTLDGTLDGHAAFKDLGGNFTLNAGSVAAGSQLPTSFTGSIAVTLQQGDIVIGPVANALAPALNAGQITLTASNGSVLVYGSGDASNPANQITVLDASGLNGQIALYGANGVSIGSGARLTAAWVADDPSNPNYANGTSMLVQNGGTIKLGTTGTPDGSLNVTYGYENVPTSGAIAVASNVTFDVSGGAGGPNISSTGGQVILRAPILSNGTVNISFHGNVVTAGNGGTPGTGVVVNAYAVWSTKDNPANLDQYFDGIIDPAGFFDNTGTQVVFPSTGPDGVSSIYPISTYGNPAAGAYTPHVNFYQNTLVRFVQNFSVTPADATSFSGLQVHYRPEIDLVNPRADINGGNISVLSNWNLGGVTTLQIASPSAPLTNYQPAYRTSVGEPGVLTLRAVNNIVINATISDGFYETYDAFSTDQTTQSEVVANLIANNPAQAPSSGNVAYNTTSAAGLMSIIPGINNGSFSYDFVAGAALGAGAPPANPDAVVPVSNPAAVGMASASVVIGGHTLYMDPLGNNPIINIPTLVRTGTGSIDIVAAANIAFVDQIAPGAVYTAGALANTPAGFRAPTFSPSYLVNPNGIESQPAWSSGGGAVTITAGGSIIGIEMPVDDANGSQTGLPGAPTGQMWNSWYMTYGLSNGTATPFSGCSVACQTAAWINFATFFQGFGALGGGNVTLTAGADIADVGASLPETLVVSGGTGALDKNGNLIPPVATYYGGGNLVVKAGGNLLSSDFLVGRGSGLIQVGGAVQADPLNPITGTPTDLIQVQSGSIAGQIPLPLLLAVQDGFITVAARGAVTLGNVYDPASLPSDATSREAPGSLPGGGRGLDNPLFGNFFTSYGPGSGVALTSVAGDVTALTISAGTTSLDQNIGGLFLHNDANIAEVNSNGTAMLSLLPATLDLVALRGNVDLGTIAFVGTPNLVPYPTQTGTDTGTLNIIAAQSINLGGGLAMSDLNTSVSQFFGGRVAGSNNYVSPLGLVLPNLTEALHANDPAPAVIAAGQDIIAVDPTGSTASGLTLVKPAEIEAGHDVRFAPSGTTTFSGPQQQAFNFVGQNNNATDITSISAGNDLIGGTYVLYGPGTFVLQAGHNMGPFLESTSNGLASTTTGLATIGNGSAVGNSFSGSNQLVLKSYLPAQGAAIDVLFGVKPGIDYAAAISQYIDPAHAGAGGIDFLSDIATILGQSRDQAWATFQTLSPARQHLLIERAFLDFLTQVAKDFNNPASPFANQYGRAYQAISVLFPARYGYTDNSSGGSSNGAAAMVSTGNLNIAGSLLETQMGGDINILGPGGGITVGHASRDVLAPNQEGILTLGGGSIRAFTDASILVNQSRIMTEQGGNIDLFSANGDISAGEGPKTYVSSPAASEICTVSGYCYVNPQGLVTGAGIAALVTLPGQNPENSNVSLAAPHGTIDAGAAGLRGNDINLVAQVVLNAFNIQASGTVTGVSFTQPPNIGALTTASNVAGATQASLPVAPGANTNNQPSVIIVEVVGYGGGEGNENNPPPPEDEQRGKKPGQQTYDRSGMFRVLGNGEFTNKQMKDLTEDERSRLIQAVRNQH